MARIGYGRCSKRDQHTEAQRDALIAAGCDPDPEHLFIEKISSRVEVRPRLEEALRYVRPGDTLVITKLDRLGRSVRDLIDLAARIEKLGVDLVVLHQNIDTSTPSGKMFFHILAAFAEFERDMIRERTLEGLEAARINKGHVGGGQRKLGEGQVRTLLKMYDEEEPVPGQNPGPREKPRMRRKHSVAKIAGTFGIAKSTVHDYVRAHPDREGASATPMPRGRLGGSAPKLDADQAAALYAMYDAEVEGPDGTMVRAYTNAEIDEALGIHRTTRYRYLEQRRREQEQPAARNGAQREEAAR